MRVTTGGNSWWNRLSLVFLLIILVTAIQAIFTPLAGFVGRQCRVEFSNDVVIRYFNAKKFSHNRHGLFLPDQRVTAVTPDRVCFADYADVKWDASNSFRQQFPEITYQRDNPLLTEPGDGSYCVRQSEILSLSSGWKTWLPHPW